jgi:acetylornithine deacetylase (ArgE)
MKTVQELLIDLIRIPSVSTLSNVPVVDYIVATLDPKIWNLSRLSYRDTAGVLKQNLLATLNSNWDQPIELALVCHTDTVPYSEDWKEAVSPAIDEGTLFGRGACDVKGALACILRAAWETADKARSLALVFTADEEIGCIGAKRLLAEKRIRPRFCIVSEPTQVRPVIGGKGYGLGEIAIYGTEAHSALPDLGHSAIYDAALFIDRLKSVATRLGQAENQAFNPPFTTLNIGTIHGGTAKNIIPGECRMLLEWRPIPGEAPDRIEREINQILADLKRADAQFAAEFNVLRNDSGFATDPNCELCKLIERLSELPATTASYGTEAPYFSRLGAETVVFGPGDMKVAHRSAECVPLAELERATDLLVQVIRELCGKATAKRA